MEGCAFPSQQFVKLLNARIRFEMCTSTIRCNLQQGFTCNARYPNRNTHLGVGRYKAEIKEKRYNEKKKLQPIFGFDEVRSTLCNDVNRGLDVTLRDYGLQPPCLIRMLVIL